MSPDRNPPLVIERRRKPRPSLDWRAIILSVAALAILIVVAGPTPVDEKLIETYHSRVRSMKSSVPHVLGDWVGSDIPVPTSAIEILHPNVLVSRRYENPMTGETASVLFVQCSDARDLQGHYPPNCYPAHGMLSGTTLACVWRVGALRIPGIRYRFRRGSDGAETNMVVDNFMLLPTGEFGRDMDDVVRVAKDRKLRHFGAAQVQILTDESMSDSRRDAVLQEFVGGLLPLFRSLNIEALRG